MADNEKVFNYEHQIKRPLGREDFFRLFNNNRVYKYLLELLIQLDKTHFENYKVFEPGCGSGSKLRFFSEYRIKPENCYGLETSEAAIEICRHRSPASMNFTLGSVMEIPHEDNMFDIILCSGLFDCFNKDEDVKRVSKELERVMKPDGILFVIDINENFNKLYGSNPYVMKKNLRPYNSKNGELENLLIDEFTIVSRLPMFIAENYGKVDGTSEYADVTDLPTLDIAIDRGALEATYTLWTFFKNFGDKE